MEKIITLHDIGKTYGDKQIISQFNLEIEKGKMYALTGPSGSGKSTLLNIIGTIEKPSVGEVFHFGMKDVPPKSSKSRFLLREKISFLFQNYGLSDNDTVLYNLLIALHYKKCKNKQQLVAEALKSVGLEGYENKKIFQLSGGEQQRVALARLLLKPSEIILADEPTGNLDNQNRDMVFQHLKRLQKSGKTLIIVTHDKELARQCDIVITI